MCILLFVYNAKSGKINTLFDIGNKLISPESYSCNLCALTHSTFSEHKMWGDFKENVDLGMEFYHKDEFEKWYPQANYSYPVVLRKSKRGLIPFLSTEKINNIEGVENLIAIIKEKYSTTI